MFNQTDKLVGDLLDEVDTSHLEKLLSDLERLSRFGGTPIRIEHKKKMIQSHVKFLLAKTMRECLEKKDAATV